MYNQKRMKLKCVLGAWSFNCFNYDKRTVHAHTNRTLYRRVLCI